MTNQKPCLPDCRPSSGSPYTGEFWPAWHHPDCPRHANAPKPAPAPEPCLCVECAPAKPPEPCLCVECAPAKPPEAPKVEECDHPLSAIRNLPTRHCLLCGKPTPAPEPQGSAMKPRCAWEPGTPGECAAYLALRAELTQAEKACALALDYMQGSPRPRHMDVVSALREVIARAKEGESR